MLNLTGVCVQLVCVQACIHDRLAYAHPIADAKPGLVMQTVAQKEICPSEGSPVHLGAAYTLLNHPPQTHLFQLPEQRVAGIAPTPLASFKGLHISMILNLRDAPPGGSSQAVTCRITSLLREGALDSINQCWKQEVNIPCYLSRCLFRK